MLGRSGLPSRRSHSSSCWPMWARSHTSGLISGWYWRRSSSSSKSTKARVRSRAAVRSRASSSRSRHPSPFASSVTAPDTPQRIARSANSSPGQLASSTIRISRCIESCSPDGRPLRSGLHAAGGAGVQPPIREPDARRQVPGGGDWLGGFGGDAGRGRVVEQGDEHEHDSRPQRVGHAVEVADLQPAPRPHRREQRGQVVVEVGDRGLTPREAGLPVDPVRERDVARDGLRGRAVHQHHRRPQRVPRPVAGRVVAAGAEHRTAAGGVELPPHPLAGAAPSGERFRPAAASWPRSQSSSGRAHE